MDKPAPQQTQISNHRRCALMRSGEKRSSPRLALTSTLAPSIALAAGGGEASLEGDGRSEGGVRQARAIDKIMNR